MKIKLLKQAITGMFLTILLIQITTTLSAADKPLVKKIGRFDVLEISLEADSLPNNPFTDVKITAIFSGPNNTTIRVNGFYHSKKTWMVRFVPRKIGLWKYTIEMKGLQKSNFKSKAKSGVFNSTPTKKHGFLRISKVNPFRLEFETGKPFYPIGQQIGWGVPPKVGFDGKDKDLGSFVTRDTFMKAFDGATNLIRSQLGCGTSAGVAIAIIAKNGPIDRYDLKKCEKLDASCKAIKQHNWAQMLTFFQDMSLWGNSKTSFGKTKDTTTYKNIQNKNMPHLENYIRYVIARWGAYVDIWELFNEDAYSPSEFLKHIAQVVKKTDPYKHPITTNYERPAETWCDIISVHEYMGIPTKDVPAHLSKEFARLKSYGKPVIYTEFGNQKPLGNVDPVKWRVSAWTAFMNECALTFWNTSGVIIPDTPKWNGNPNAYLGLKSRQYFKVLMTFTKELEITLRPVASMTDHQEVQVWALGNKTTTILYLHNYTNHKLPLKPGDIIVDTGSGSFLVEWISPASGDVLKQETIDSRGNMLWVKSPSFKIDLVAKLTRKQKEK